MCGIAGVVVGTAEQVNPQWLRDMSGAMEHRGPDDAGWLQWSPNNAPRPTRSVHEVSAQVGFCHQRLAIIDLSEGGWQPMCTADGRYALVFNGEIYNYIELRVELEQRGHTFVSESDTEVLLEAFAEWGPAVASRLVGMFAFAVLDTVTRTLTLVRDPFGIKPLHYATWPGGLGFASEIKSLLHLPGVSRRASAQALLDYLDQGAVGHSSQTMFDDVKSLPPGSFGTLTLDRPDRLVLERYWSPPENDTLEISFDEASAQVRDLFLNNLSLHLRSDVPVGTALSGGVDSSAIIAGLRVVGGTQTDIRAFSYIADDPSLSEEKWIDLAVGAAEARVVKITPNETELLTDLDYLIRCQEEPFGSTSIYAQHRVFRAAAEHGVKVMLDGQGADEMLAGYHPYISVRIASLLRRGDLLTAQRLAFAGAQLPGQQSAPRLLAKAGASLLPPGVFQHIRQSAHASRSGANRWIDHAWFASHGGIERPVSPASTSLHEVLRRDITSSSLPALLRYEDRNSMAFSVESRVPFLTTSLVDFVLRLPASYLLGADGTTKTVFRSAMRGIVPDGILDRRDKIGFATPERQWLGGLSSWVDSTLDKADRDCLPGLRLEIVKAEWAGICAGQRPFGWHVWRWLNLVRWMELFQVQAPS